MQKILRHLFGSKKHASEPGQSIEEPRHEPVPNDEVVPYGLLNQQSQDLSPEVPEIICEEINTTDRSLLVEQPEYRLPSSELLDEQLKQAFNQLKKSGCKLPILWSADSAETLVKDLSELQAVLIAGTPGSGKSNLLHQFILSLLYTKHPSTLKLVLLDYKGLDLNVYKNIEKQFLSKLPGQGNAVVNNVATAELTLNSLCIEMDRRYELMRQAGITALSAFQVQTIPSIVLIIDNVEGFITQREKEISPALQKLITMGYKAEIFVILSTSDLHYKVFPTELLRLIGERIALRLNSREDYRKLFETTSVAASYEKGAFHYALRGKVLTGTSMYLPLDSIKSTTDFVSTQPGNTEGSLLPEIYNENDWQPFVDEVHYDDLLSEAARLIVANQMGSTSLIQRRMKLGYNRAGRLMNQLEAIGVVGAGIGSKAREVLFKTEQELEVHLEKLGI